MGYRRIRRAGRLRSAGRAQPTRAHSTWVVPPFGLTSRTAGVREEALVASSSLPGNANLEHLRGQARTLQRAVRRGDADALARATRHHQVTESATYTLAAAQLVIAREYGFPSWVRLKRHLDVVAE